MFALRPVRLLPAVLAALPMLMGGSAFAANRSPVFQGQPSVLPQAEIERLAANADKRSIIILKNQHPEAPPRIATGQRQQAVDSDQAPIRGELAQLSTPDVKSFHVVNAVAATILTPRSIDSTPILPCRPSSRTRCDTLRPSLKSAQAAPPRGAAPDATPPQTVCPSNPEQALVEPEALQVMNVEFQPGAGQPAAHDLVDGTE